MVQFNNIQPTFLFLATEYTYPTKNFVYQMLIKSQLFKSRYCIKGLFLGQCFLDWAIQLRLYSEYTIRNGPDIQPRRISKRFKNHYTKGYQILYPVGPDVKIFVRFGIRLRIKKNNINTLYKFIYNQIVLEESQN